jgi:lipoprotein NlpD
MSRLLLSASLALVVLTACNKTWAPVEDRSASRGAYMTMSDGTYRVRRGDSLHAIAFNFGLDWREIARWNGIEAPYVIYPDQVLRLGPAPKTSRTVTTTAARPYPSSTERVVTREAESGPAPGTSAQTAPVEPPKSQVPASQQAQEPRSTPSPTKQPAARPAVSQADPKAWRWPVDGRLISRFKANDPSRNGIEIGGSQGQPVRAAAGGEVVYSGNGLIGYGELIIIKHSDRMLSAYGHNRKRLVAEGQAVAAGEQIAEMGKDERNRSLLHFEIRRDGTPQDPLRYLPAQ